MDPGRVWYDHPDQQGPRRCIKCMYKWQDTSSIRCSIDGSAADYPPSKAENCSSFRPPVVIDEN